MKFYSPIEKEFQSAEIVVKNALLALKLSRNGNNSLENVKQECELEQSVGLIKCVRNELE